MLRFRISNMTCGGCAKGVAATLREAEPRAELQFDLDRREVILGGAAAADIGRLEQALRAAGWRSERLDA